MEDPKLSQIELGRKMAELTDDVSRWKFMLANREHPQMPPILLDNDYTFITFYDVDFDYDDPELDEEDSYITVDFDDYIGWVDGVCNLLQVLNIKMGAL